MFIFPGTPLTAAVYCVLMAVRTSGPPHEGRLPFPWNLSMKIISNSWDFGTTAQRRPVLYPGTRMSFIWWILMELLICKLHVCLSRYSTHSGGVLCADSCTHQRPPHEGKLPFPRNLSMKIISDSWDLVRLRRGDPVLYPGTKMSFIW